jgi:hypothetical protein
MHDKIIIEGKKIVEFFRIRALNVKLNVNCTMHPDSDIILGRILYDEVIGLRQFEVVLTENDFELEGDAPRINGFIKKAGIENDIELMYISVTHVDGFLDTLWLLYFSWMHCGIEKGVAEKFLENVKI